MSKHARPKVLSYKNKSLVCCHACEEAAKESTSSWVHWEAVDTMHTAHVCSGGMKDPMLCGAVADEYWWWAI